MEEKEAIQKAQYIINGIKSIPCTACGYCTEGCPKKIPIPEIFAARNKQLIGGQLEEGDQDYQAIAASGHRVEDCIGCKQCEKVCPQQIQIVQELQNCG